MPLKDRNMNSSKRMLIAHSIILVKSISKSVA